MNRVSDMDTVKKFQTLGKTKLVKGTILSPEPAGLRFVLSVNNMVGKAETKLHSVFDKKWKKVREETRGWYANKTGAYKLGAINTTAVQSDTWVIHMLCQDKDLNLDDKAVEECLKKVCDLAKYEKATVHISSLLKEMIPSLNDLLNKYLVEKGISVYTYEEPGN